MCVIVNRIAEVAAGEPGRAAVAGAVRAEVEKVGPRARSRAA